MGRRTPAVRAALAGRTVFGSPSAVRFPLLAAAASDAATRSSMILWKGQTALRSERLLSSDPWDEAHRGESEGGSGGGGLEGTFISGTCSEMPAPSSCLSCALMALSVTELQSALSSMLTRAASTVSALTMVRHEPAHRESI